MTKKLEKLLKLKSLKDANESELFLYDEIVELKEEVTKSIGDTSKAIEQMAEQVTSLADEVKKKDSELVIELDPEEIRGKPGKDGYTPKKGVDYFDGKPGEPGKPGRDGHSPIAGVDYPLPEKGEKGDPGAVGERGPMPKHEWRGKWIRWEIEEGKWGEWVNTQGEKGDPGRGGGAGAGVRINGSGTASPDLVFTGDGVSVSQNGQTTTITIPGGIDESLAIAYAVAL